MAFSNTLEQLEASDVFLPDLFFIDHIPDAIPGGLMPIAMPTLTLAGEPITPLLPLNHILLEYFTPEELSRRIRFQLSGAESVQVTLDLPLSGLQGKPVNYRLSKTYELNKENAQDGVPILEVWPHLCSADWKEYYVFYYDAGLGKDTFQIELDGKETHTFKDSFGGIYRMWRLEQYPTVIRCQDEANQPIGIILLKQPDEVMLNRSWKVGVDFGDAWTNIYIQRKQWVEEPFSLSNLLFKVTEGQLETRFPALFEYFIPEEFLPIERPLPLQNVLSTRGGSRQGTRPILDGRIYIPNLVRFDPKAEWIETDIRVGGNAAGTALFLKHLVLHISAIAASQSVKQIQWSLSYPSDISSAAKHRYLKLWQTITQELQPQTGITYLCPKTTDSPFFRPANLAFAQYFADVEKNNLIYTTCIQMEQENSNLSVWENNRLVHQCTLALGDRHLLSNFLELNPKFIEQRFNRNLNEWQGLEDGAFHAKLSHLLRWESEQWLKEDRPTLHQEEDMQGLTRLMAIGFGGLYYYVGILLRVLNEEGKYGRESITPVYFGGNNHCLLNWLDPTGTFTRHSEVNDFLSRMLACGSGFEDTGAPTRLSKKPKDEVACGLVLDPINLQGLNMINQDSVIMGENCELNGIPLSWNQRLETGEDVASFRIPTFSHLAKFLYDFHDALEAMEIEGIRPIKDFKRSFKPSDNRKIWEGTRRELEQLLQSQILQENASRIRIEPPFILGLKALLNHLGRKWAE